MRSTPEPSDKPLVLPPKPAKTPVGEVWRKTETPGIEQSSDGRLRTTTPPPPVPRLPVVHDEQCED